MKKLMLGVSLLVLLGLVVAASPTPGVRAQGVDDGAVASWDSLVAADAQAELDDATGGRPLPPRLVRPIERLMQSIMKECPCNGPDGAGWADHAAFVTCVTAKVDALKAKGLPDAMAAKIIAHAGASKIGTDGFTCPDKPKPGDIKACLLGVKAVHEACPCDGPEGKGWASHQAFVDCVTAKVADLQAGSGLPELCAKRIVAGAEKSPVGNPGFTCPSEKRDPGQPGAPGRPGRPGPRR
jgi:hypothetical protein